MSGAQVINLSHPPKLELDFYAIIKLWSCDAHEVGACIFKSIVFVMNLKGQSVCDQNSAATSKKYISLSAPQGRVYTQFLWYSVSHSPHTLKDML